MPIRVDVPPTTQQAIDAPAAEGQTARPETLAELTARRLEERRRRDEGRAPRMDDAAWAEQMERLRGSSSFAALTQRSLLHQERKPKPKI